MSELFFYLPFEVTSEIDFGICYMGSFAIWVLCGNREGMLYKEENYKAKKERQLAELLWEIDILFPAL